MPVLNDIDPDRLSFDHHRAYVSAPKRKRKPKEKRQEPQVLTVLEAAEFFALSDAAIERLISSGELQSFKVGGARRITRKAIDDYIEKQSTVKHVPTGPAPSLTAYRPRQRGRNTSKSS